MRNTRAFWRCWKQRCGEPTPFRHSETPCFLPGSLIDTMARYGREMVEQLLANPQYRAGFARGHPCRIQRSRRRSRAALRAGRFRTRRGTAAATGGDPGLPYAVCVPAPAGGGLPRSLRNRRRLHALPGGLDAQEYHALLRAGHRRQPRSRERRAARDRPRAPEDAPRFPADRAGLRRAHRRHQQRREAGQSPLLPARRRTDADPAHLQSRHRGRTGAQADSDGLRFPRRPGRGVGRAIPTGFSASANSRCPTWTIRRCRARASWIAPRISRIPSATC